MANLLARETTLSLSPLPHPIVSTLDLRCTFFSCFFLRELQAHQRRSEALPINRAIFEHRGSRLQVHRRGVRLFGYTTIKGMRRATI